jgi:beta-lactamase superfamily II metal-dependent hydrolase
MINDPNTSSSTMLPPKSGVSVRMYNPGFGDCFLLAFPTKDEKAFYTLIDCGVHHQFPKGKEKIRKVAADIAAATNKQIDLVVVTHEHSDHISGFNYAREIFNDISIENLWLAWTEDPTNELANKLKESYGMRIRAISTAIGRLNLSNSQFAERLKGILNFEIQATNGNSQNPSNSSLDFLRTKSKIKLEKPEDYRRPEEPPLSLPNVDGVKISILGPPKKKEWIKLVESKSELYPELTATNEVTAFVVAILGLDPTSPLNTMETEIAKRSLPFDKIHQIKREELEKRGYEQFFHDHYYTDEGKDASWRCIENDWLFTAEQLALSINNYTNNTSLVLAIELTKTEPNKVLLFVGDAQIGNWLSWIQLESMLEESDDIDPSAQDLLRRVVLYKTGHHGSHNATPSRKGLERMESPDLVAMIPVNEQWAKEKMHWQHPAEKIYNRLMEKTRGRVLRSDMIPINGSLLKPSLASEGEWAAFIDQIVWDNSGEQLWIQFTVSD